MKPIRASILSVPLMALAAVFTIPASSGAFMTGKAAATVAFTAQSDEDRDLTRALWEAIGSDPNLSASAKHIKIIVLKGFVTLKGSVSSEREKKEIEAIVKEIAGEGNVDSQIEVVMSSVV